MRFKPKTNKDQWDEIVHYFYQDKCRFHENLREIGIEWDPVTFEQELVALRRRIQAYAPLAGVSLSEDEERELAFWIEQRIHDALRRAVDACLKRFAL